MFPPIAVLAVALGLGVGTVRAGSPSPSVLEYNRSTGRFRIARINAGPGPQSGPSGIEQVVRSVFDPLTNAVRVYAAPNPPGQAVKPTSSDQIFTSIFNSGSNALQVKCVAGCGGSGGSVALSMPPEFVVSSGSGTITVAKATQTANSFYAGPLSGAAAPAFRSLVPADLPAATASSQGALQLAGDLGGSAAAPKIVSLQGNAISSALPSPNQVLAWNGSASQWAPATLPAAPVSSFNSRTGAIVPAVGDYSFTQISGGLTCTQHPALTGDVTTSAGSCATTVAQIQGLPISSVVPGSSQVLEWVSGAWTPTTLAAPLITSVFGRTGAVTPAANDYSFPQISGSVAPGQLPAPTATTLGGVESLATSASKWINAISTTGAPSATQPAFTDISGSLACGQLPAMTGGDVTSAAGSCAPTVTQIQGRAVSNQQPSSSQVLAWNGSSWAPATGGGTPRGAAGSVQYNASGSFGGFGSWNGSLLQLPAGSSIGSADTGGPGFTFSANSITSTTPLSVSGSSQISLNTPETDPTCSAANYLIWTSSSASRLKQCNNGTASQFVASGVDINTSDQVTNGSHITNGSIPSSGLVVADTLRSCEFDNDTQSATALTNAQITGRCQVPYAATVVEIDVWGSSGTPSVMVEKNHTGTATNLLSGALATNASGAIACASNNAACWDGTAKSGTVSIVTTGSANVLAAGDKIDIPSATAGGTATWFTVQIYFTVN